MYERLLFLSTVYKKLEKIQSEYAVMLPQDERVADRLELTDLGLGNQAYYFRTWAGFPVYQNTDLEFYAEPEKLLEAMQNELRKARKFIFMEWHMLEDSVIWKGLEEILKEKAEDGVEIRILLDGRGCKALSQEQFSERMKRKKIQCRIFHKKRFPFQGMLNYCDYRKNLVIDGRCAFAGDYDFVNAQFNIGKESQLWKISGICMKGDAVRSQTLAFLKMWNVTAEEIEDPIPYLLKTAYRSAESGFVLPFTTNPMSKEDAGAAAYLNLVRNARKYIYLMTPEKEIDPDLKKELTAAAKRGVRVYLMQADSKDKKTEHPSWDDSRQIRVFRYTRGNLHARQIVSDDQAAIVGNVHMDASGRHHHFENGCWFANCRAVVSVKRDFEKTLPYCIELV